MITKIPYKDHSEWLEIRNNYIGGSDSGAVIGFDTYKSPYALWAEKRGLTPPFDGNVITRVGSYLEELVAQMFAEETGKKVRRCNFTMVNDEYPFACANVDRLIVGEDALLEIKTSNSLPVMKRVAGGEFPEKWYCQMVHYLAVTGLKRAYLAVLIGCREFRWFVIERDEAEIAALMSAEREFWEHVESGEPPLTDGTESTSKALTLLYPESDDRIADLSAFERELEIYMSIGDKIKELEATQDEAANKIKSFMTDAGKGESLGYKVSWSSSTRRTFDAKRFAADNPGLDLGRYYKELAVRPFKVTKIS